MRVKFSFAMHATTNFLKILLRNLMVDEHDDIDDVDEVDDDDDDDVIDDNLTLYSNLIRYESDLSTANLT